MNTFNQVLQVQKFSKTEMRQAPLSLSRNAYPY